MDCSRSSGKSGVTSARAPTAAHSTPPSDHPSDLRLFDLWTSDRHRIDDANGVSLSRSGDTLQPCALSRQAVRHSRDRERGLRRGQGDGWSPLDPSSRPWAHKLLSVCCSPMNAPIVRCPHAGESAWDGAASNTYGLDDGPEGRIDASIPETAGFHPPVSARAGMRIQRAHLAER